MNPRYKSARFWALLPIPLFVILINSFGPDGWREPFVRGLWLSWACIALAVTHFFRKALHDYASGRTAFAESIKHPIGAGLSFLGLCILGAAIFFSLSNFARAQDVRTYVPEQAKVLAPLAVAQIDQYWPTMPVRSHMGSLIEQETCISLKHRYCWSPTAKLKTSREEGAGLGQLTRAWSSSGALRFDALQEVKSMDPTALRELNWDSVYSRVDLNMRAILVKLKDCDSKLSKLTAADPYNRTAFCDAAYNGGMGGLLTDRKLCAFSRGCDPQRWFDHTEHHSNKSRAKWQGYGLSAFEINREHVKMAMVVRRPKYVPLLGGVQ